MPEPDEAFPAPDPEPFDAPTSARLALRRTVGPSGLPLQDDAPKSPREVQAPRRVAGWSEGRAWCTPQRLGAMTDNQAPWLFGLALDRLGCGALGVCASVGVSAFLALFLLPGEGSTDPAPGAQPVRP